MALKTKGKWFTTFLKKKILFFQFYDKLKNLFSVLYAYMYLSVWFSLSLGVFLRTRKTLLARPNLSVIVLVYWAKVKVQPKRMACRRKRDMNTTSGKPGNFWKAHIDAAHDQVHHQWSWRSHTANTSLLLAVCESSRSFGSQLISVYHQECSSYVLLVSCKLHHSSSSLHVQVGSGTGREQLAFCKQGGQLGSEYFALHWQSSKKRCYLCDALESLNTLPKSWTTETEGRFTGWVAVEATWLPAPCCRPAMASRAGTGTLPGAGTGARPKKHLIGLLTREAEKNVSRRRHGDGDATLPFIGGTGVYVRRLRSSGHLVRKELYHDQNRCWTTDQLLKMVL